jgi:hypothetical protein
MLRATSGSASSARSAAPRADRGAGALDGQERLGQHRQGDVPVPGLVAADLVVVESGLGLALLEAAFNLPSRMHL